MSKIILHLDMDAFFAAIEELDHPEYRGKPVVVGADPKKGHGRGVVSTCNYEARKYGIHSAMPISHAYKRCPHAIFTPPQLKRYSDTSKKIMSIMADFSPDIEPISVDEAFLDITSTHKFHKTPRATALLMKKRIFDETQLTCSVGIAPSKFIAKIASDLEKPDGLVIVEPDKVIEFLHPLDISRVWGIGKKTLPHLHRLGIKTIGDLAKFSEKELADKFGKAGVHYWRLANGIDPRSVHARPAAKSISKEVTFFEDKTDPDELLKTLLYQCNEVSREMRRKEYWGRTITLRIRFEDFSTFSRSHTMPFFTNNSDDIFRAIKKLFNEFDRGEHKIRLIGAGVSHLQKTEGQMDLFSPRPENANKLDSVLDKVREKFGEKSITRASLINAKYREQYIRDVGEKDAKNDD